MSEGVAGDAFRLAPCLYEEVFRELKKVKH